MDGQYTLIELKDVKNVKGKYSVSSLVEKTHDVWRGTLNDGEFYFVFSIIGNHLMTSIAEREYDIPFKKNMSALFLIKDSKDKSKQIISLNKKLIKEVLILLEWEFKDEQIWCD